MDAKTLFQILQSDAKGWRFNRKYWTKAAWHCDATTLIQMVDYLATLPTSSQWHCFYKAAKARGLKQ